MSEPRTRSFPMISVQRARRIGAALVIGALVAASLASFDADARRLGGGRSFGRQSSIATQRSMTPPPAQPGVAQQPGLAAQRAATPTPTPGPAARNRNRWLAPIAGLAAGLGIAALLSHFGLGGAFAGMMANVIVLVVLALLVGWLIRRFAGRRRADDPAFAAGRMGGRGDGLPPSGGMRASGGFPQEPAFTAPPTGRYLEPEAQPLTTPPIATGPSIPAGFDSEMFLRNAKVYFVRLQAAWDVGDIDDIREFTTPEMFSEIRVDLADRGATPNRTDVVQLNADLLDVSEQGNAYVASVRFHGLIREAVGAAAEPFAEVWNFSKSPSRGEGWLLAGIQQIEAH